MEGAVQAGGRAAKEVLAHLAAATSPSEECAAAGGGGQLRWEDVEAHHTLQSKSTTRCSFPWMGAARS